MQSQIKYLIAMAIAGIFAAAFYNWYADTFQPLTAERVGNYAETLPEVEKLHKRLVLESKGEILNMLTMPPRIPFSPYAPGISELKTKQPDEYQKLSQIVTNHHFKSPEDWSDTGEHIMSLYRYYEIMHSFDEENQRRGIALPPDPAKEKDPEMAAMLTQRQEIKTWIHQFFKTPEN